MALLVHVPDELSSTERTVATLAAPDLSNREIARRAFLRVKAVEANLTSVYRKLGVRRAPVSRPHSAIWSQTRSPRDSRPLSSVKSKCRRLHSPICHESWSSEAAPSPPQVGEDVSAGGVGSAEVEAGRAPAVEP